MVKKQVLAPASGVTIGFSTTNKFMSWVIRSISKVYVKAMGGDPSLSCSHAWIAFYDMTMKTRLVMQAETWGYEVRPWNRWIKENRLVAEFRPCVKMKPHIPEMAKHLGEQYDFASAFLAGTKMWLGRWLRRLFRSPRKMMCSEAVIRFLSLEEDSALPVNPELTLPHELLVEVTRRPEQFIRLR